MSKNKFRAWHKEKKCWMHLHNNGYSFNPSNGQIYYEGLNITSRIILVQCTGFLDKKGTEVYEGDILETIYDGNLFVGVVVYDESELNFKVTNGEENYGSDFQYIPYCDEVTRIGNIYDHPELLRKGE